MKIINNYKYFTQENILQLKKLIGVTITAFDFDILSSNVLFNHDYNYFEIAWPNWLTLISHSGMKNIVNIKFGGEIELNELKQECVNFKLKTSTKNYSKGGGISMNWFEICKVDIFSNNSSEVIDNKFYGDLYNNQRINFVESHNCNKLEYNEVSDEILLLTSNNKKKIMLQVTESINGTIIMHFNEEHIVRILQNKYHTESPLKNYNKRLTIE
ncbi:MAG: hypothetical protein HOP11_11865 [Saprospiraceae bacterium]|nr:hypothetical protein [Saprospiraceae bacterium]